MLKSAINKINGALFLRITILAGMILSVAAGGLLTVFILMERNASKDTRQQDNFSRILRRYDTDAGVFYGTDREAEYLNGELDKLEKTALSVESWLSVLKRRRALAALHSPSLKNYRSSIQKAHSAYPYSQQIASIAAASLIKDSAVNREAEEQLRQWLRLFSDPAFNSLRLAIHVLLGDFRNPARAASVPPDIFSDGTESLTIDLAIMKILNGNFLRAASDIQNLLSSPSPSKEALFFAAEYFYDSGDLLRSAEIFSQIDDEKAMMRQADALYLAGFEESAGVIWRVLSDSENEKSIYNLAVTSRGEEAADYLERLINRESISDAECREAGLIRYSRLLDSSQAAITVLQMNKNLPPASHPLIDLEIVKRQSKGPDLGRQLALTWLLLDRHFENEDLYNWAAWHFLFQRGYDEAHILFDRITHLGMDADWKNDYRAVLLMSEGRLDEAQNTLLLISSAKDASWAVHANLGRILEARRSTRSALEQYEQAAVKVQNPKTAAQIQIRIARCLSVLNRQSERIKALQYALELDPENLKVRLELERGLGVSP